MIAIILKSSVVDETISSFVIYRFYRDFNMEERAIVKLDDKNAYCFLYIIR